MQTISSHSLIWVFLRGPLIYTYFTFICIVAIVVACTKKKKKNTQRISKFERKMNYSSGVFSYNPKHVDLQVGANQNHIWQEILYSDAKFNLYRINNNSQLSKTQISLLSHCSKLKI